MKCSKEHAWPRTCSVAEGSQVPLSKFMRIHSEQLRPPPSAGHSGVAFTFLQHIVQLTPRLSEQLDHGKADRFEPGSWARVAGHFRGE